MLASRIEQDGDRDGLPNVLMEAQLCGLAAVSTAISAIPELLVDGMKDLAHRFGVSDPLAGDGSPNSDIHQPAAQ